MKKIISYLVLSVFLFINVTSVSLADDKELESFLGDLFGTLKNDSSFGFNKTDQVVFSNKTSDSIDVTFPIVSDGTTKISKYNIWGSTMSMEGNSGGDYDSSNLINQTFDKVDTSKSTTTVKLKGLKSGTKYYVTISPLNKDEVSGNISKEFSFTLDSTTKTNTNTTKTNTTTNNQHGAGNPNMNFANVSWYNNGKSLTMTWTALDGADKIEIAYQKMGTTNFTTVGKPSMNDGKFTFTVPEINTYIIKMQPLKNNAMVGTEIHQTIHMKNAESPKPTPTPKPLPKYPKTGPAENAIAVLLGTILVYSLAKLWKKV